MAGAVFSLDYKHPCPSSAPTSSTEEIEIATPLPGKKFCGSRLIFLLPSPVFEGTSAHPGKILAFLSPKDIVRLVSASKEWYTGVFQDSRSLWNPSRYLAPIPLQTALPDARKAALAKIAEEIQGRYPLKIAELFQETGRPIAHLPVLPLSKEARNRNWTLGISPNQMPHSVMRFTNPAGSPGIALRYRLRRSQGECVSVFFKASRLHLDIDPTHTWHMLSDSWSVIQSGLPLTTSDAFPENPGADHLVPRLLRGEHPDFVLSEKTALQKRPCCTVKTLGLSLLAIFVIAAAAALALPLSLREENASP